MEISRARNLCSSGTIFSKFSKNETTLLDPSKQGNSLTSEEMHRRLLVTQRQCSRETSCKRLCQFSISSSESEKHEISFSQFSIPSAAGLIQSSSYAVNLQIWSTSYYVCTNPIYLSPSAGSNDTTTRVPLFTNTIILRFKLMMPPCRYPNPVLAA